MSEPDLHYLTHDQMLVDVEAIAAAVERDNPRPDYLVGIGRGGLVPAVYLSHRLGVPVLSIDYSAGMPDLARHAIAALAALTRAGRSLLLVDDINDSGDTIAALRSMLREADADMERVRLAVLIDNLRSGTRVDHAGHVIDREDDKRWFVFPWEAMAERHALIEEAQSIPARLA